MGRYTGSVCRLCRREGIELFLKGTRCLSDKCSIKRRGYAPGQHGQTKPKITEYNIQLREKQKLKRMYGLNEGQFHSYFVRAEKKIGITGEILLQILERRLDNIVYRLGFASSRKEGRQLVTHKHFQVNGRSVDIPSFLVKEGDVIEVKEKFRSLLCINSSLDNVSGRTIPEWMELDKTSYKGVFRSLPTKAEMAIPVNEQLVVELYSR